MDSHSEDVGSPTARIADPAASSEFVIEIESDPVFDCERTTEGRSRWAIECRR